jgi:hypothetical protein
MVSRATELVNSHKSLILRLVETLDSQLERPDHEPDSVLVPLIEVTVNVIVQNEDAAEKENARLLAAAAQRLPHLADRLASATERNDTFPSRRSAIHLLGCLGQPVEEKGLQAIVNALRDVWYVQSEALATFERLIITKTEGVLNVLFECLKGDSALASHAAAGMLARLATSPQTTADERQDILEKLTAAATHSKAEKNVFKLDENTGLDNWCVHRVGRLRELLYRSMLVIAGLA